MTLIKTALLGMALLSAGAASTQANNSNTSASFPDRPLTLAVSYGSGGATDFQARIVTMVAARDAALGQPVHIINKPGAGGRKGWNWFATQVPSDGYTLSAYNVPHFIAQSIRGGVHYSPDSFEPIANWGADPAVVVVPTLSPFQTMGDIIRFARANPGELTTSGAGLFVGHHIAALQIEKSCRCRLAFRPADGGGAAAMKALIDGKVIAGINNLSDAFRAQKAGKVRILGVADLKRHAFLPDVPTLKETGLDVDDASVNYRGLMVPKGTPQHIIDKLTAAVPRMFVHSQVKKRMKAGGAPMRVMARDEVLKLWQAREKKLRNLLAQF